MDAGCGSGRDTKTFLEMGYSVTAFDASIELVRLASIYTGQPIKLMAFEEMNYDSEFDGIWSFASLLHVPSHSLLEIMKKMKKALKENGVWYLSFRLGEYEENIEGRYFHSLTQEKLMCYLDRLGGMKIMNINQLSSYENNNQTEWIHCLLKKVESNQKRDCKFCLEHYRSTFDKILFEGKHCYVAFDNFPTNKGHLLIISRQHYENYFETPLFVKNEIIQLLDKAKNWLDKEYAPTGYNIGINCGIAAGQSIFHVHVHLIPRYHGDSPFPMGGVRSVIRERQTYCDKQLSSK